MQINTSSRRRITAVLGPTNTGKTFLAIERMIAHESGMIGFPLRLLARENYDKVVAKKGKALTALITGEEKIIPPGARYFLCTVESMPVSRAVAFLGVDEIQLCADPDRGHIFTDRLLHARGTAETMFMGADTIRPLIRRLIPDVHIEGRERLSVLRYAGNTKVTRLPKRSAVVAFSAADVYALAELVRRQRGGAAVVLGALSPRTRNAQVDMFQAGEVDYLVATDAIGMGLNMEIDHVAFAAHRKFDGRVSRELTAAEIAQIAGRAGRYMNDGTFGGTVDAATFDPEIIDRIENHNFADLKYLNWRSRDLSFVSLDILEQSLAATPDIDGLRRARLADDQRTLQILAREPAVMAKATNANAVRLLWDVCRIPDFRKIIRDAHTRLLGKIYGYLMSETGKLPADWVAGHVNHIDRVDGDIDTLVQRLDNIRTWTYVSYHSGWLDDALHWQGVTRAIEDKLSDALHERLTNRFVDQRTSVLMRRLKEGRGLDATVEEDGKVTVEGHFVGCLSGFRFVADSAETRNEARALDGAARNALKDVINARVEALAAAADDGFTLDNQGAVLWRSEQIATLAAGHDALSPRIEVLESDLLAAEDVGKIQERLDRWIGAHIRAMLEPLFTAREANLEGAAKGLVYQLGEALGSLPRAAATDQVKALSPDDRRDLRRHGIRIVRDSIFVDKLLRPASARLRALLWCLHKGITPVPEIPKDGRTSVPADPAIHDGFYEAVGYRKAATLAVRLNILERLADMAWDATKKGPATLGPEMMNLAGCGAVEMAGVLEHLGYRAKQEETAVTFSRIVKRKPKPRPKPETPATKVAANRPDRPVRPDRPNRPDRPDRPRRKGPPRQSHAPRNHRESIPLEDSPFAILKDLVKDKK